MKQIKPVERVLTKMLLTLTVLALVSTCAVSDDFDGFKHIFTNIGPPKVAIPVPIQTLMVPQESQENQSDDLEPEDD